MGLSGLRKTSPDGRMEKSRRRQFSVSIVNQATRCIQAHPSLFTHLDVRVSCNNLCHMASTLSVVSCRICQAHNLLRHTLTHTAMHIDYDRLYAFGHDLINTGVLYRANALPAARYKLRGRTFAFIHPSKLALVLFTIKSCFVCALRYYRVIHISLRDFRTRLLNNQDRHGRKEHINR